MRVGEYLTWIWCSHLISLPEQHEMSCYSERCWTIPTDKALSGPYCNVFPCVLSAPSTVTERFSYTDRYSIDPQDYSMVGINIDS